ncbi:calcineurin-like phosphoesterase family protein [Litorimonas taeanensis]|uniref:Calcineurin-like phosphoesterase family protein n=1 Tax=Litorimonas taeanensis TaxID=568099 RepID=A0A420WE63_9PROT|nr:phosphodiesterase [Litorimonas taeanensis]RKQ69301.1 calcineurin-like phosphoesterase family protein [Litorimonas taeanensis]
MIIAQITDLHLGFHGENASCTNRERLRAVLSEVQSKIQSPDLILFTGDLVEIGEDWAYEDLREELETLSIPYYFAFGNHDNRSAFSSTFPEVKFDQGFLQYTIDDWPLRIIVLDSLEVGRHGGGFCSTRAKWLHDRLSEQPDRPTLIALHHPPMRSGIDWMTVSEGEAWVNLLQATLEPFNNVVHIMAGHIHRSIFTQFLDIPLVVCSAVAPQVKLELADIQVDKPDHRILLTDAPAGYCLHQWDGHQITTHNGIAPDGAPIIRYDDKHAFVIRHTLDLPPKEE